MSVITTLAWSTITELPITDISTDCPCSVGAESSVTTSAASTLPLVTWYSNMSLRAGISASKDSRVPSGRLAKASSVGAKTVNWSSPLSTPSSSAACRAVTSVVNLPSATAISTMVFATIASSITGSATAIILDDEAASVSTSSSEPHAATIKNTAAMAKARRKKLLKTFTICIVILH